MIHDTIMSCKTPHKVQYETEGKAIKALKRMPKKNSYGNAPYPCEGHWHIGRYLGFGHKLKGKK